MNPKLVIPLAAAGALILLVCILRLGSAPAPAEPSLPGAAAGESAPDEIGAPSLTAPEKDRERERLGEPGTGGAGTRAPAGRTPIAAKAGDAGAAPTGPVRGRVLDVDGVPLAGAGIFVGPFGSSAARGIRLQSNSPLGLRYRTADGADDARFSPPRPDVPQKVGSSADLGRFEVVRPGAGSFLHARGDAQVPVYASAVSGPGPDEPESILVVARPSAVAGVVVDESGRPIEGATVAIRMPDSLKSSLGVILDRAEPLEYYARSGTDGRFEIADAPAVPDRILVAELQGLPTQGQPLTALPEMQVRIAFQLAPQFEVAARGVVVDGDGKPVPDATVRLGRHDTRSGLDGKFLLDATETPSGTEIVAAKAGFSPARANFEPGSGEITLRLGPPTLRLAGRVVDAAGKPIRSVEVRALGLTRVNGVALEDAATWDGPGPFTVKDTDNEGKFELGGLQPRTYVLGLLDRNSLRTMRTEPFLAGRTDLEIRFVGDGAVVHVAGRVVDRGGAPVPRAEVRLVREIMREEGGYREGVEVFKSADEEGIFDFPDMAGDVRAARVGFPGDIAYEHPLEAGQDLGHLTLIAFRRAHFQIEIGNSEVQPDFFGVLDGAGRAMPIMKYEGSIVKSNMRWGIQDGRSETLTVLDAAETVVLYQKGAEVGRASLRLVPGDLTVVRP